VYVCVCVCVCARWKCVHLKSRHKFSKSHHIAILYSKYTRAVISQNFWQLLLPSEPPSEAMIPLPSSTLADLESLAVGVLVQVREGAPPLALLAAGERSGLQPLSSFLPSSLARAILKKVRS